MPQPSGRTYPETLNILRPLSPHLPIYKPQLTSTFPISHRISGAFLATIVLFFYLLCLKMGLICFTYENFYQFFFYFYSSKLILISVEITALALSYHLYNGVRHLLTDFSGFLFLRIGRKRLKWLWLFKIAPIPLTLRLKKKMWIFLLNFTLIALFFKAYAVEADIGLLAFYLHLPEQDPEGLRFVWDELARSRPEDFPRRVASFRIIRQDSFFLVKLKKKEFELFWFTFSHAGRLSACVPKWRPFFCNGYTREKSLEFDLSLYAYALKRGHGLFF